MGAAAWPSARQCLGWWMAPFDAQAWGFLVARFLVMKKDSKGINIIWIYIWFICTYIKVFIWEGGGWFSKPISKMRAYISLQFSWKLHRLTVCNQRWPYASARAWNPFLRETWKIWTGELCWRCWAWVWHWVKHLTWRPCCKAMSFVSLRDMMFDWNLDGQRMDSKWFYWRRIWERIV